MTVPAGYFSTPNDYDPATAVHQTDIAPCPVGSYCASGVRHACPAGRFGAAPRLTSSDCNGTCSGEAGTILYLGSMTGTTTVFLMYACARVCLCLCLLSVGGYYCPENSTSPEQAACGDVSVYCPAGAAAPTVVLPGEYGVGLSNETQNATSPCPSGSYCVLGVMHACPSGRFGCASRLSTAECNGPCNAGYYCPAGSTNNQPFPCGGNATSPTAAAVYCPSGASRPLPVAEGNFSVSAVAGSPHLGTAQSVCPVGSYCVGGVRVRRVTMIVVFVGHFGCVAVLISPVSVARNDSVEGLTRRRMPPCCSRASLSGRDSRCPCSLEIVRFFALSVSHYSVSLSCLCVFSVSM